ncbi:MAG: InlB B-repeat-containing protein [Kiritimatiellae bacterium]|nr:InlB B-repeat-containing protein [Kiritimatiellia bacterium]
MKALQTAICMALAMNCAMAATTKTGGVARFALCQTPALEAGCADPVSNIFDWVGERLVGDEDAVVLPEYAFTTFSEFAGAWDFAAEVWDASAAFAAENSVWLFVNHPNRAGGADSPLFNETRVFSPQGETFAFYRKRELANMDRAAGFSRGDAAMVAGLPFGDVGILVCKDAQYPEKGGDGYVGASLLLVQFAHPGVDDPEAPEAKTFDPTAEAMQTFRDTCGKWSFLSVPYLAVNKAGPDGNYNLCGGTFAADDAGNVVGGLDGDPGVLVVDVALAEDGRIPAPPAPAQRAPATYTVKFNACGGALPAGKKMAAQTITCGKAAKLRKNAFAREGYVFAGWATSKANAKKWLVSYVNAQKVSDISPAGGTTSLYAVWARPKYKVAFYANGGAGATVVQTVKYGKATTLAKCKFKAPKGRKFAGWATSKANAKAGKVKYRNGAAIKGLVASGKTVKLYAVWKKK